MTFLNSKCTVYKRNRPFEVVCPVSLPFLPSTDFFFFPDGSCIDQNHKVTDCERLVQGAWDIIFPHGSATTKSRPNPLENLCYVLEKTSRSGPLFPLSIGDLKLGLVSVWLFSGYNKYRVVRLNMTVYLNFKIYVLSIVGILNAIVSGTSRLILTVHLNDGLWLETILVSGCFGVNCSVVPMRWDRLEQVLSRVWWICSNVSGTLPYSGLV